MGKAPAFQFYVKDWLSDVELQSASASSRGIWINALCMMWESRERGVLTGKKEILARLLNCTQAEFDLFLKEASVTNFADVTICNKKVTIKNRRMWKDENTRKKTRLRVSRHRSNAGCNAGGNAQVTPPSSSSSSSSFSSYSSSSSQSKKKTIESPNGDLSPLPGDAPASETTKIPQCPVGQIIEVYHEILPNLPTVRKTDKLAKRIRCRWREDRERQNLGWWRELFARVAASDFLTGRVMNFQANLHWLTGPENMTKLLNGQYDNRGPRTGDSRTDQNIRTATEWAMGSDTT